jgi:hypothetical protein|tara:strand:- start:336 stop:1202 length:867 start_codon:yes stop_codon:yes gene_type:complete
MSNTKDGVDYNGFPDSLLEALSEDNGVNGNFMLEPWPKYIQSPCENVTQHGNSWIVLGRDRPASRASGYAGQGHTQASSIDIVVGRGAPVPDHDVNVDPSFSNDAARIYISQKTDIDDNFALRGANRSVAKSGIGIKADAIRIIGRQGIKLTTSTRSGIEIMAGNDDEGLQPMVKGQTLVDAFAGLEENLNQLSALVLNFLKSQASFNASLAGHVHMGAVQVGPTGTGTCLTTPSITLVPAGVQATLETAEAMVDNFKGRMNSNIVWHNRYLNPASSKYICSKYNKVN